jgi:hypothetical protein
MMRAMTMPSGKSYLEIFLLPTPGWDGDLLRESMLPHETFEPKKILGSLWRSSRFLTNSAAHYAIFYFFLKKIN